MVNSRSGDACGIEVRRYRSHVTVGKAYFSEAYRASLSRQSEAVIASMKKERSSGKGVREYRCISPGDRSPALHPLHPGNKLSGRVSG